MRAPLPPVGLVFLAMIVGCAGNDGCADGDDDPEPRKRQGCAPSEPADDPGGCSTGDRAADDGTCPPGEVCSDDTPFGLFFDGAELTGLEGTVPAPTVVGGQQTILLTEQLPDGSEAPLSVPFGVQLSPDGILRHVTQAWAEVTLAGVADGQTWLRITEPGGNLLYDRYTLEAAILADVTFVAPQLERRRPDLALAFLADGAPLGVALRDATGRRLVDTSLVAIIPDAPVPLLAWDVLDVASLGYGLVAGEVDVDVIVAGTSHPLTARWVDAPLALALDPVVDPLAEQPGAPLTTASYLEVCGHALAGETSALEVAGLVWTFEATADALVGSAGFFAPTPANCAWIYAPTPGPVTLTARAAGLAAEITVDVLPAPSSARARPPMRRDVEPASTRGVGERAGTSY